MILQCDCSSGDAYVTKTLTMPSDFWVQFDVKVPQTTIDAISSGFTALFVAFPDPPAGWGDDGLFLAAIDSLSDVTTTGSPSTVADAFSADVFHAVRFHVNGTAISWWLDGSLLFTYTGGWSPGDLSGSQTFDFGGIFSSAAPGEVYFLDNVKVGTSSGASDIFADDFESGTLAAWDTTVGAATVVGSTDFSLSLTPSTVTFTAPGTHTVSVDTVASGGDTESIALTITGLPAGVTGAFSTSPITAGGSSTLSISAAFGVPVGTYIATVHATGADNTHTASLTVVIVGTPLTRDTIVPTSDPPQVGSVLQINTSPGEWAGQGGSMVMHQGVPYVAWTEAGTDGAEVATIYQRGPYVAKWNGSDWDLLAGTGSALIPDNDHSGRAGPGVMTYRQEPVLASDGTNLYLACKGELTFQYLLNPLVPSYYYATRWSILVWKWDGATWTEYGPGFVSMIGDLGVFSMIDWSMAEEDQALASSSPISLVASPDEVGACYVAYSDWSTLVVTSQPERGPGARTVAIGLGAASLAETLIDSNASAPSADGVGSEFAVYYQETFYPTSDDSQVLIWTPGGSSSIPMADFVWSATSTECHLPKLSRIGGDRYLMINVVDDAVSFTAANLVFKIDPATPDVLDDLIAGHPELNVIEIGSTLAVIPLPAGDRGFWKDGAKNYWALLFQPGGVPQGKNIYQLDRRCLETDAWNFAAQDGVKGGLVAFDPAGSAFWQYDETPTDPRPPEQAIVSRSLICRGCQDCANVLRGGLNLWQRF